MGRSQRALTRQTRTLGRADRAAVLLQMRHTTDRRLWQLLLLLLHLCTRTGSGAELRAKVPRRYVTTLGAALGGAATGPEALRLGLPYLGQRARAARPATVRLVQMLAVVMVLAVVAVVMVVLAGMVRGRQRSAMVGGRLWSWRGGAVEPLLVAVRWSTSWITAAAGAKRRVRAVRIERALHGHRAPVRLSRPPYSAGVGGELSGVHTCWVCLKRYGS